MEDYKDRFMQEYKDLLKRTVKLESILAKFDKGELDFIPTCPVELLRKQLTIMKDYLTVLDERAGIEGIELSFAIKMNEE